MRLGFIGTGAITEAIVTGLLRANCTLQGIAVSPRSAATALRLSTQSSLVRVGADNQDVTEGADIVFLAIRPQIAESVVRPLRVKPGTLIASLIATVPNETLRSWLGPEVEIVRAVPLPSLADLRGVTVIYPKSPKLEHLFAGIGSMVACDTIDEFDAFATAGALMGTYFGFAEACALWLTRTGVPYEKARSYLTPLFQGLAESAARAPGVSYEELRRAHTTAGGLNEQLFARFQAAGGEAALRDGLNSVADRIRRARTDQSC